MCMTTFNETYFRAEFQRNAQAEALLLRAVQEFEGDGKADHAKHTKVMLGAVREIKAILQDVLEKRNISPEQEAQIRDEAQIAHEANATIQALE